MPTTSSDRFPTIRTEGAILPADLLQRIAAGDRDLPGLDPSSYHLIEGEKLNEATNRAWNRLQSAWASFRAACEKLSPTDPGVGTTRDRWLLPLFQELGYGRLQPLKSPFVLGGKSYPISHVWSHVPIHLVGCRVDLDKRSAGSPSPHSLVQEFLNRSEEHLWGFLSNGLKLRILRDNIRLTRQAYVEFDLQAMFEGNVYADFALLWRLCHQSRVEVLPPPHPSPPGEESRVRGECWLERWSKVAEQQGLRILDQLRTGVEQAIKCLGSGFLSCPANQTLRDRLRAGQLQPQHYYHQLLRLVYRLLFLFVAEDRELLFDPKASEAARDRYHRFYSTSRLRRLAERLRGTQHTDLYQMLSLVMDKLGSTTGCPELGLPALGSFLFSPNAIPDLHGCQLANADLLDAIRALALTSDGNVLRTVDYRNLGSEELGSVYESLLELHPKFHAEAGTFELHTTSGHERKTTGSYYTPSSLINCLLDSALDPVLDEAARKPDPEAAILALKVCDPACGSGHFLIAAAHRIAKRLAAIRTGEDEPAPAAYRNALRDVIGRCLYGVDLNPMAVELCKVALWMEALVPGKPLSFLDHHIQCGNSLIGATPELLAQGIPDEAFESIEGDDKKLCTALKRQNKKERADHDHGQLRFPWEQLGNLAAAWAELDALPSDRIEDIRTKEQRYAELVSETGYRTSGRFLADLWCAAFVWRKTKQFDYAITEDIFRRVQRNPHGIAPWMYDEVRRLAQQYQFFHWHLAFPDVFRPVIGAWKTGESGVKTGESGVKKGESGIGSRESGALSPLPTPHSPLPIPHSPFPTPHSPLWTGGFDVVLGNPPWERIKLQEQEWFAQRRPDIARARNKAERRRLIERLSEQDPALYRAFLEDRRQAEGESHFVRHSGRYPLCGRGDVNTYMLFAELNRSLINPSGRVGCIVPSGIATDDTTKHFFQDLVDNRSLVSLYDFENRAGLFPAVDSRMKFCLLTLTGPGRPVQHGAEFAFFLHQTEQLADPERRFTLTAEEIALVNPNTRTCPIFRTRRDAELTKAIYRRVPVLVRGEWGVKTGEWGVGNRESGVKTGESAVGSRESEALSPLPTPHSRLPTPHSPLPTPHSPLPTPHSPPPIPHSPSNPWGVDFLAMFHMANDSHLFRTREQLEKEGWQLEGNVFRKGGHEYLPLYEAKMLHQFDHRWATYEGGVGSGESGVGSRESGVGVRDVSEDEKRDPQFQVVPRYWVPAAEVEARLAGKWDRPWLLGWRDTTNTTNQRTVIASILPRVGVGNKVPLMLLDDTKVKYATCLVANLSAFVYDYAARQKIGGITLNFFLYKQLPVLPPEVYAQPCPWDGGMGSGERGMGSGEWGMGSGEWGMGSGDKPSDSRLPTPDSPARTPDSPLPTPHSLSSWLLPRVLELVYTAWDMQPFAEDMWGIAEWGMGSGESGVGVRRRIVQQWEACHGVKLGEFLSRLKRLERSDDPGRDVLSADRGLPEGGIVRHNESDSPGSRLGPGEHRRGLRPGESGGVRAILENLTRFAQRVGDPSAFVSTSRTAAGPGGSGDSPAVRQGGPDPAGLDSLLAKLISTPDSPLPIPPFRWNAERRFVLRCELDAAFFHLYGIGREDVDYILDTFPIVRRKDEKKYGEYRTKRVILEIYDALADAIRTGQPYQTRLAPQPADPRTPHVPGPSIP